ncbi:MAG: D-aminoacylase, partial [Armatimonadetes bacterium]|nr:D-aminoacylase [Armatimonadota bacterium]
MKRSSLVVYGLLLVAGLTLFGVSSSHGGAASAPYDLVLRGGRVADGTGNPAAFRDVALRDGRIAAVGLNLGPARAELSVAGKLVAPGFIDVHTHAENVREHPRAENFVRMGVTTLVLGNCGGSVLDVGELFRSLEAAPPSVNVASLIGHNTVRREAMGGAFDREPSPAER